jgi:hypothetical protein
MARRPSHRSSTQVAIWLRLIDRGTQLIALSIKAITILGVAYFETEAIKSLAGQETSVFVEFLTNTPAGLTAMVGTAVGGLGGVYGLWQRNLHRRAIAHFAPRLTRYEQGVDPNRTSTGLTPFGETNPEDE